MTPKFVRVLVGIAKFNRARARIWVIIARKYNISCKCVIRRVAYYMCNPDPRAKSALRRLCAGVVRLSRDRVVHVIMSVIMGRYAARSRWFIAALFQEPGVTGLYFYTWPESCVSLWRSPPSTSTRRSCSRRRSGIPCSEFAAWPAASGQSYRRKRLFWWDTCCNKQILYRRALPELHFNNDGREHLSDLRISRHSSVISDWI